MKTTLLSICLATLLFSNNDIANVYNNFRIEEKVIPAKTETKKFIQNRYVEEKIQQKDYQVLPSTPVNELNLVKSEIVGSTIYGKVQILKNNLDENFGQPIESKEDIFSISTTTQNNIAKKRDTSALESNFRLASDEKVAQRQINNKSQIRKNFKTLSSKFYQPDDIEIIE